MHLTHLSLTHYRNYNRLSLDLPRGPILLQGNNAQGKTNLLEAIAFLSTTRSVHARTDQQLIHWLTLNEDVLPFARVEATVQTQTERFQLAITLVREQETVRKTIHLNGSKKRAMEVIGKLTTVMFLPEDIELVIGPPTLRRRYLDTTLCQINPTYCRALSRYNKILVQRNALLKELGRRNGQTDQLIYWNEQLALNGAIIAIERHQALFNLDVIARQHHRHLSSGHEGLRLHYVPSFNLYQRPKLNTQIPVVAEELAAYHSPIASLHEVQQIFLAHLQQTQPEELKRGVTLIGPHRDDFLFLVDGVDMNLYGSRGQQRTAALSAKIAEITLMQQVTQEMPILLLDDVMSELDAQRRHQIIQLVEQAGQALLTTTDWDDYDLTFRQQAKLFTVNQGQLRQEYAPGE